MLPPSRPAPPLVEPLGPDQVTPLYPIVRVGEPGLTMPQWRRYAGAIARGCRRHGVLVARRPNAPFPSGVLCYVMRTRLRQIRIFEIEHLAAAELLDTEAVLDALLQAAEALASRAGCSGLRVVLPSFPASVVGALGRAGHRLDGVVLGKTLLVSPGTPGRGRPEGGKRAERWPDGRDVAHDHDPAGP